MLIAKVVVRPDGDVFIVRVSFDLVIQSSGEGVGAICGSRFILKYDVVLFPLREVSCDTRPDFAGVAVISEVCVVGIDYDRDRRPF
jgi:hypothetical protein